MVLDEPKNTRSNFALYKSMKKLIKLNLHFNLNKHRYSIIHPASTYISNQLIFDLLLLYYVTNKIIVLATKKKE